MSNAFDNFIDNFQSRSRAELTALLSQSQDNPCIINVFVASKNKRPKHWDFSEEARMGGVGKSMVTATCSWEYYRSAHKIKEKDCPMIDLAVQYTTQKDILAQLGIFLGFNNGLNHWLDTVAIKTEWSTKEQEQFEDIFVKINAPSAGGYDPSYVAVKLFSRLARSLKKKGTKYETQICFFDSYDWQWLGDESAPLRRWLRDSLFPFLVKEMCITVVVSGREPLQAYNQEDNNAVRGIPVEEFQLRSFTEDQCLEYIQKYPARRMEGVSWGEIEDELKEHKNVFHKLTDGKAILLDLLADLLRREIIENKKAKTVKEVLDNISAVDKIVDLKKKFKHYVADRMHNQYLTPAQRKEYGGDMADAVFYLSIAKHGLESDDFYRLRNLVPMGENVEVKNLKETRFFKNIFNQDKLSYVKGREEKGKKIQQDHRRRLHDEMVEIFQEYYLDQADIHHEDRKKYLAFLFQMYKHRRNTLDEKGESRFHDRYPRLMLEYMDYRFAYRGRDSERNAINRYLYEFSYYLNRYSDLNSRLIEKARAYYERKKSAFNPISGQDVNEKIDTLSFKCDFNLLAKLRLREAHYWLAVQKPQGEWQKQVQEILAEISFYGGLLNEEKANEFKEKHKLSGNYKPQLDEQHRLGLFGRILSIEGELSIWEGENAQSRLQLKKAKEIFYQTGDSHGMIWVEHLLGFESQRRSRFVEAETHHRAAIESTLLLAETLLDRAQAEKDYKGNPTNNWLERYRLRYLIEVLNRAGSNLAVRRRYEGRLLDAIKALNANLEVADLSGIREEVRTKANLANFAAVVGSEDTFEKNYEEAEKLEPGFDDPLLRRRVPLAYMVHLIKVIGLESRIYRSMAVDFNNFLPKDRVKVEAQKQKIKESFESVAKALLPPEDPMWPTERDHWALFKSIDDKENPLYDKPMNREMADMYYQCGKLVLSTRYVTEGLPQFMDWVEVARQCFDNARLAAERADFLYLRIEACESLYRLAYLSPDQRSKKSKYKGLLEGAILEMQEEPEAYGLFYDLISRRHITEGDFLLEEALSNKTLSPMMFEPVLHHYTDAIWAGYMHNQERFRLTLSVFTHRLHHLLEQVAKRGGEEGEFAEYFVEDVLMKTEIYKEDPGFHIYLNHFIKALKMELSGRFNEEKYKKVKIGIGALMERGKFTRAADVNMCLVHLLEKELIKEGGSGYPRRQLALRYFQQVYCFQGANRWGEAQEVFEQTKSNGFVVPSNPTSAPATIEDAILWIAKGTNTFRTKAFWNVEKFIADELPNERAKFKQSLDVAEPYFLFAIKTLWENIKTDPVTSENKPLTRLLAEAFFRLGELYILRGDDKVGENENLKNCIEEILKTIKSKPRDGFKVKEEFVFNTTDKSKMKVRYDDSPALRSLNTAYYLSKWVGDQHRTVDSLQSIAAARYLGNPSAPFVLIKQIHAIARELNRKGSARMFPNNIQEVNQHIDNPLFPILEAKSYLVEGNAVFSECFFYICLKKNECVFELKEEHGKAIADSQATPNEEHLDIERAQSKVKSGLHRMIWAYLKGLDILVDETRNYENYHFKNMAFEINRRLLSIPHHRLVRMIIEDLPIVWSCFPKLDKKRNTILDALLHDLKVHEVALAAKAILTETPTSP